MRYLCFDSALNEVYTLLLLQKEYPHHTSLFQGTKDERIWHVAPWIFQMTHENIYKKWDDPNCHLQRCLIIESSSDLNSVKEHLQQFIYKKINDAIHFNRFWDAKILPQQLERMERNDLLSFFEEIGAVYVEHEKSFLKLSIDKKDRLAKQMITEKELFDNENLPPITEETKEEEPKVEAKPKRRFFYD